MATKLTTATMMCTNVQRLCADARIGWSTNLPLPTSSKPQSHDSFLEEIKVMEFYCSERALASPK
jgi:hypothetical protein